MHSVPNVSGGPLWMWHLGRMEESAVGWQGVGRSGHAEGGCAMSLMHVGQMMPVPQWAEEAIS